MSYVESVRHLGIVVRDLEKMLHFYEQILGLTIRHRANEVGSFIDTILGYDKIQVHTVKLITQNGTTLIELLSFNYPKTVNSNSLLEFNTKGITHIALTINNIDTLYEILSQNGIVFISKPQISPNGKAKVAFCRDPEDNILELVEEIL